MMADYRDVYVGVLNVIPYLGPIIGIAIVFSSVWSVRLPDLSVFALMLRIAGTILFAQEWINLYLQPLLYSNRAAIRSIFPRHPDCGKHGRCPRHVVGDSRLQCDSCLYRGVF